MTCPVCMRFPPREVEVLQGLARGLRVREIADELCVSVKTVETYILHIRKKARLAHMGQVIVYAVWWSMVGVLAGKEA